MKIFAINLEGGKRVPVLFRSAPSMPVLVPFLFVILKRQYKKSNTIRNDLTAIKFFYQFHEEQGVDVDELLIKGDLDRVVDSLESFLAWLSSGRRAHNIAGTIGKQVLGSELGPTTGTRDGYLKSLKVFFAWCVHRYCVSKGALEASLALAIKSITNRIDGYLVGSTEHRRIRSFNDAELAAITEFSHPKSPLNPFRGDQNRIRNYLMNWLFKETGIRRGELLLLTTKSINRIGENCYITIDTIFEDELLDDRASRPSLKTVESRRTIAISTALFDELEQYIKLHRRPVRKGIPMRLKHGFLFTSERGTPLSLDSLNAMFRTLKAAIRKSTKKKNFMADARIHSYRHRFAEDFLRFLIEVEDEDMERAKDELRSICGWTANSKMPETYARRYINNLSNQHNMARVNNAQQRYQDNKKSKKA